MDLSVKKVDMNMRSTTNVKETDVDLFKELETRLKLRELIARKKAQISPEIKEQEKQELSEIQKKQKEKEAIRLALQKKAVLERLAQQGITGF